MIGLPFPWMALVNGVHLAINGRKAVKVFHGDEWKKSCEGLSWRMNAFDPDPMNHWLPIRSFLSDLLLP